MCVFWSLDGGWCWRCQLGGDGVCDWGQVAAGLTVVPSSILALPGPRQPAQAEHVDTFPPFRSLPPRLATATSQREIRNIFRWSIRDAHLKIGLKLTAC